jgi:hypothetical protein
MNKMDKNITKPEVKSTQSSKKPNEQGSFYFSSSIKIFDPQTQKVFVHKRCN